MIHKGEQQLKNMEMLTDKIRFKWMKQYRVISEDNLMIIYMEMDQLWDKNYVIMGNTLSLKIIRFISEN